MYNSVAVTAIPAYNEPLLKVEGRQIEYALVGEDNCTRICEKGSTWLRVFEYTIVRFRLQLRILLSRQPEV